MASHYRDAAKCLKAVDGGRTTLKTAAYKTQNPPRTVALVSEVRRHRKALETAIAGTWFLLREVEASNAVVADLVFDRGLDDLVVVRWRLPASKSDQAAAGVERGHGCCCYACQCACADLRC